MPTKCREHKYTRTGKTHTFCKLRKQLYHILQLLFPVYLYVDMIYRYKLCFSVSIRRSKKLSSSTFYIL